MRFSFVFLLTLSSVVAAAPPNPREQKVRADKAKVAAAVGAEKARVAGADLVVEATGYPPGGVAPFGLRAVERVLIDKRLLGSGTLWVGAGSERHMAGLPATELVRVARAQQFDVTVDE